MKKPELLAPAGNMEKLQVAIHYGADAVYLGGKSHSLRNLSGNFTSDELAKAVDYSHDRKVKVYLTVNTYPDNEELPDIYGFLEGVAKIPFDAYIVADPGVIEMVREISPEQAIHLSTQANTTNWKSALFWQKQGIKRINLAREMSLKGICELRKYLSLELEVFIHGALCISYSGRCLLSSIMANRKANKGECSQPCRWSYALVEETRPGQYFPVFQDHKSTFIFNSKDLCLVDYLPQLVESGVDSLKIEGRMKGINYVASVVRVYREAIDRFCENPVEYSFQREWLEELCKISHRGYTTGFLLGAPKDLDYEYNQRYERNHEFIGIVREVLSDGALIIDVRNRMTIGETVEFLGRGLASTSYTLQDMTDEEGIPLQSAHPNQRIIIRVPFPASKFDLIRQRVKAL